LARHIQEFFHDRRRQRVEKFKRPGQLLDIGCGDGTFIRHMAAHGWQATGFDLSPTAQRLARKHNKKAVILTGKWKNLKLPPASFDCLTLWQVLEHVADPRQLLRRCHTLLRPGGLLVVAVPNIASLQAWLTKKRWWGLDVPRHLTHFSPEVLKQTLQKSGFRIIKIKHFSLQYGPYALFHSYLDYVFTRRHFLSDFTKRTLPTDMSRKERLYNLACLALVSPFLIPLCLTDTLLSPALGRGGFIEVYAQRN
jgi:SAM-dependent methyltransferase